MKAACIQMRSGLSRGANIKAVSELIAQAADKGAELVLTPEMTNIVDRKPRRLFENLPEEGAFEEIDAFAALAKKHQIHLVIGSMAVALNKKFGERRAANRSYFFNPAGVVINTYDKIHMFDVDLPDGESWKESSIYAPGEKIVCTETTVGRIGHSICYDVRFPGLYRKLAQAGAEIILIPAAFTYQTGKAHWKSLLRARAIETGSFVMAAAQGGEHEDGRHTWGHSMIIDPWGEVLAEKADTEPGVIVADIDLEKVREVRQRIPNLSLECDFKVTNIKAV